MIEFVMYLAVAGFVLWGLSFAADDFLLYFPKWQVKKPQLFALLAGIAFLWPLLLILIIIIAIVDLSKEKSNR